MIDGFGRRIDYLRISVTDRCDLRCRYCMAEKMTFLPRKDVLTLEEIAIIADRFIARGVKKIRLSGGEPLVRRDFGELAHRIGRHLHSGALEELTLTTNGTRLAQHAENLAAAGMKRINVSIDSLDPETYAYVTRGGDIAKVHEGLAAATAAGMRIKINMVAMKGLNGGRVNIAACSLGGAQWALDRAVRYVHERFTFGATFIYATGKPYTAPTGYYQLQLLDGSTADFFEVSGKNALRLPDYHRFDISATYDFHLGRTKANLGLSIFNLYNRRNVWYKEYDIVEGELLETNVSLLSLTPSLFFNWTLK